MKKILSLAAAAATVAVLLVGATPGTAHAAEGGGQQCQNPGYAALAGDECGGGESDGNPTPPGEEQQPPGGEQQSGGGNDEQGDDHAPKPFEGEEPTDGPGQWAKSNSEGAQGVAEYLRDRLADDFFGGVTFSADMLQIYAIMWALGWLLAIIATMIAVTRMADRRVDGKALMRKASVRLLFFAPISAVIPAAAAYLGDIAAGLGSGFLELAKDDVIESLDWLIATLGGLGAASIFVPGGTAVLAGVAGFLAAAMVGVVLELLAAKFIAYLMVLLLPVVFAASINPAWSSHVKKVSGGLIGAFLTPPALFLVWAGTWSLVSDPAGDADTFMRFATFFVGILVSLAAPVAVGMVLSHVVPGFMGTFGVRSAAGAFGSRVGGRRGAGGPPARRPGQPGSGSRSERASRASDIAKGDSAGGVGPGVTTRGSAVTAAGPSGSAAGAGAGAAGGTAGAGAGAGAAGAGAGVAAAGPAGIAVAAFKIWDGIRKRSQSAARGVQQAAGDSANRQGGAGAQSEPSAEPTGSPAGTTTAPRRAAGENGKPEASTAEQNGRTMSGPTSTGGDAAGGSGPAARGATPPPSNGSNPWGRGRHVDQGRVRDE